MAKRYLIIQTAFIGDVILATPVIETLKKSDSKILIDVLVKKENKSVLTGNGNINELFTLDKSKKIQSIIKLVRKFRKNKYEVIINLHRFASSGLICVLSGAQETRGFDKNPFSMFYTKKFNHQIENGIHEVDRNLKLTDGLVTNLVRRPHLEISDELLKKVSQYQSEKYYCLAIASVWKTKEAPLEIWTKLIKNLDLNQYKVFLLGGTDDSDKNQKLQNEINSDRVINLCGKLSLIESAALMKNAERNFVNDSAPLHLSSSVNAPVTVFYCSTSPTFGFGPLSDDSQIIEVTNLPCKPCGLHGHASCPKGHFKCGNNLELG